MIYFLRPKGYGKDFLPAIADMMEHDVKVKRKPVLGDDNIVIRWGSTLRASSLYDINNRDAISAVSDKRAFRQRLEEEHLCPLTWFHWQDFADERNEDEYYIIRQNQHTQGRDLFISKAFQALHDVWMALVDERNNGYITEYIEKTAEYRVFCADGHIVGVSRKWPEDPSVVVWNGDTSSYRNVRWGDWPLNVCHQALAAMDLTDLDFGAVDVIVGDDLGAYVLEINTAPRIESKYKQQCFAKVFDWMLRGGETYGTPIDAETWKDYIHPAVWRPRR